MTKLLDPELLLAWAAFLASDECTKLLIRIQEPPVGSVSESGSAPGSFKRANSLRRLGGKSPKLLRRMSIDNLESALAGTAATTSSIPGLITSKENAWLPIFIKATAQLQHAVSVVDISVAGLRTCCLPLKAWSKPLHFVLTFACGARFSIAQL